MGKETQNEQRALTRLEYFTGIALIGILANPNCGKSFGANAFDAAQQAKETLKVLANEDGAED